MQTKPLAVLTGLAAVMCVASCSKQPNSGSTVPGVVRQSEHVYLMENHSAALLVWHAQAVRRATVVHMDTHDDCRFIEQSQLDKLTKLLSKRNFEEVFRLSDNSGPASFTVHSSRLLYDLGNFLYPCLLDGTVSTLYWVIPDTDPTPERVRQLASHMKGALRVSQLDRLQVTTNAFSFGIGDATVHVLPFSALPAVPPDAMIDLDIDFFNFSCALSTEHIVGRLVWDPQTVLTRLSEKIPHPGCVTIASSVPGGYLLPMFRFLADAVFDFFQTGRFPAYADHLFELVTHMRTANTTPSMVLRPPSDPTYLSAYRYLGGLLALMQGDRSVAIESMTQAAASDPAYRMGLLNLSELLLMVGDADAAEMAINAHDEIVGHPISSAIAARVRLCLARGDVAGARGLAERLLVWERLPYFLLLQGAVLTSAGAFDEARATYEEVLQASPRETKAMYNLGVLFQQQGQPIEALRWYEAALGVQPSFAAVHENMGQLFLALGDTQSALKHLEQALVLNPQNQTTLNNLGLLHRRKEQWDPAIRYFQLAIDIQPAPAAVHVNLIGTLLDAGRREDAANALRLVLKNHPDWSGLQQVAELAHRLNVSDSGAGSVSSGKHAGPADAAPQHSD